MCEDLCLDAACNYSALNPTRNSRLSEKCNVQNVARPNLGCGEIGHLRCPNAAMPFETFCVLLISLFVLWKTVQTISRQDIELPNFIGNRYIL